LYKYVFLSLSPPLLEAGELPQESASENEAPEADESRDGDDIENLERSGSPSLSSSSANSKGADARGKRKRVDKDVQSSGTFKDSDVPHKKASTSAACPFAKNLFDQALSDSEVSNATIFLLFFLELSFLFCITLCVQ
jgi:hypothetical protein